jgi:hypothetical protein
MRQTHLSQNTLSLLMIKILQDRYRTGKVSEKLVEVMFHDASQLHIA